jgi:photosystem II stability/assembly factor-like uncharacterized protein
MVGGDVTSVDVLSDGSLLVVVDGKLATATSGGGSISTLPSPSPLVTAAAGGGGEIYGLDNTGLWVWPSVGATPVRSTVYQRNGQTESMRLMIAPDGRPIFRAVQFPNTMLTYTSTDRGTTWTEVDLPTRSEGGGGLAYGPNGAAYCSSPSSFYVSSDNGVSWAKRPAVLANYGGELFVRSNGHVYYYVPSGGGLWRSTDRGASFTEVSRFNNAPFHQKIVEGGDGHLYSLVLAEGGGMGDRSSRLMRSTDGGSSWSHVLFVQGHDVDAHGATIAVGFGSSGCGGLGVSRNNGAEWVTAGLRQPTQVQDIALDKDQQLVIMADKGLFLRGASGWTTMGARASFTTFAATPTGSMFVGGTRTSYASSNGGTTWTEVDMPDIPIVGTGRVQTPVVLGLKNGECLISLTHFRSDLTKHTNGILSRITPDGRLTQIANSTNYVWMVQDAAGTVYARTDNFVSQRRSTDNGASFIEVTQLAPGFAFTSDNRAINHNGTNGFTISNAGFSSTTNLTVNGLTGVSWMVTKGIFDDRNRLYLLSTDQGVFRSTAGL